MYFKVTLRGVRATNFAMKKAINITYSETVCSLSFPALKPSECPDITIKA